MGRGARLTLSIGGLVVALALIGGYLLERHGSAIAADDACTSPQRLLEDGQVAAATDGFNAVLSTPGASDTALDCARHGLLDVASLQCSQAQALLESEQYDDASTMFRALLVNPIRAEPDGDNPAGTQSATSCGATGLAEVATRTTTTVSPTTTTTAGSGQSASASLDVDVDVNVTVVPGVPDGCGAHADQHVQVPNGLRDTRRASCASVAITTSPHGDGDTTSGRQGFASARLNAAAAQPSSSVATTAELTPPPAATADALPERTWGENVEDGAADLLDGLTGGSRPSAAVVWAILAVVVALVAWGLNRLVRRSRDRGAVTAVTITDSGGPTGAGTRATNAYRHALELDNVALSLDNGTTFGALADGVIAEVAAGVPQAKALTSILLLVLRPWTYEAKGWTRAQSLVVCFSGPGLSGDTKTITCDAMVNLDVHEASAAAAAGYAAYDLMSRPGLHNRISFDEADREAHATWVRYLLNLDYY